MDAENTRFTCPDCHGSLQRIVYEGIAQYRCRIGHTYSTESVLAAHSDTEENNLWTAIVTLEEGADLADEISRSMPDDVSERLQAIAKGKRRLAQRVREVVSELPAINVMAHVP